jgi:hypothetical protein
MSYIYHDADMYEPVSGGTTCPFHKANPSGHHPGCTCSTYFGYRRVSDETYRAIKARKQREREDRVLAEARTIRARRKRAASADTHPKDGDVEQAPLVREDGDDA